MVVVRRTQSVAPGALAKRLGLSEGEIEELLERLPFGERTGAALPEAWERPQARRVLEQYAARKRVVSRLAVRGLL
jgi:hypothetical protein